MSNSAKSGGNGMQQNSIAGKKIGYKTFAGGEDCRAYYRSILTGYRRNQDLNEVCDVLTFSIHLFLVPSIPSSLFLRKNQKGGGQIYSVADNEEMKIHHKTCIHGPHAASCYLYQS